MKNMRETESREGCSMAQYTSAAVRVYICMYPRPMTLASDRNKGCVTMLCNLEVVAWQPVGRQ